MASIENSEVKTCINYQDSFMVQSIDKNSFYLEKKMKINLLKPIFDISGSKAIIMKLDLNKSDISINWRNCIKKLDYITSFLYIPQYSIYLTNGKISKFKLYSILSSDPKITNWSDRPVIFFTSKQASFKSIENASLLLNNACNKIYFDYPKNSNTFAVKIKSYIDSKYMDINNLKDFAMQNNKSKSLVSSTFKSEYGISPKKYLNNLRVQEAIYRLVLRGKDEKVVDIAYDVGFKDLSRFNKQFKLFTRNTPRDMK